MKMKTTSRSIRCLLLLFLCSCCTVVSVLGRGQEEETCSSLEGDGTCRQTTTTTATTDLTTKQSEIDALVDLYHAMGDPYAMKNWADGKDPCVGEKDDEFDAGFAWWQGIACQVCSDDDTHLCVRSTFLHLKGMVGSIPSTFANFDDLEILLLSGNNITGALPDGMLSTFPKLRRLDLSYNEITGDLPLADLEGLTNLRQAFFDNNKFTGVAAPATPPFTGGYDNLMELNLNYNHDMDAPFPVAIAYMPRLSYLKIHDTHLTGRLPTNPRAFFNVEMLQISGSTICGDIPRVCTEVLPGRFDVAFCDMTSLKECTNGEDPESTYPTPPPIRLGCPNRNYGVVTLEVYKQVLTNLEYDIETITNLAHRDLYPLFLENPRTTNTVDIVVTSDLPQNHDTFLQGHHDMFVLAGTSYEKEMITIVVPDITSYTTLSALATAALNFEAANRKIYTFDEDACPVCEQDAKDWRDRHFPSDFEVQVLSFQDLSTLAGQQQANPEFVMVSWIPHGFNTKYELHAVDMQAETKDYLNQGKALIRKDAIAKLGPAGMGVLSAILVPTADVETMDNQVQEGNASPAEAAEVWIMEYSEIVDMWSWH